MQLYAKFKKNSLDWLKSHLKIFWKVKVAQNPPHRIFNTLQKVTCYCAYHNSILKDDYRARISVELRVVFFILQLMLLLW